MSETQVEHTAIATPNHYGWQLKVGAVFAVAAVALSGCSSGSEVPVPPTLHTQTFTQYPDTPTPPPQECIEVSPADIKAATILLDKSSANSDAVIDQINARAGKPYDVEKELIARRARSAKRNKVTI